MTRERARQLAEELVGRMTAEEKAGQLRFDAPAIERLGIPAYNWWNEGLHGLARGGTSTSFPQAIGMAAMLDGASDGQVNRYIVLPYIKPIIRISVIFAVTGSLESFDLIYVLTNGGPMHATEVPSTLMINMLFLRNRYGMGSTIAVMLIVLCFGFALLISAIFREEK